MRADRLLNALLLLQAHGRLTGRELAKRLEVSIRTVHRDMEALSASGVPIYALRGAHGGWQLDEDWRTRVPGLDEAELRALLMAQPRILGDPRLAAAAERALAKLMAALPVPLRERAVSIRQRLYVDTTAWRGTTENLSLLPVVQDAVSRDRKLVIQYRRTGHEPAERTVDPLGLIAKGSTWYLVAQTPAGLRTYRVSRIEEAKLLDAACKRPANFDLEQYWKSSTQEFRESWQKFEAVLRLDAYAASWVQNWRIATPVDGTVENFPDGNASSSGTHDPGPASGEWKSFRIQFQHPEEACFVALGLGPHAEVIEPASLRDRVAAELTAVFARRSVSNGEA